MIVETVLFVLGIISFFAAYLNLDRLSERKIYETEVYPLSLGRWNMFRFFHAIFFPWAYFKPWKVKEGWTILMISVFLLVLSLYLIYEGITY